MRKPMGRTRDNHRPLLSGVRVASGRDPTHMALTYKNIRAFIFHDAVRTLRDGANGKGRVIVPPKRSSFRLLAVIICCAAALWLSAACGDGAFKDPSTLCETNSSAEEGTATLALRLGLTTTPDETQTTEELAYMRYDSSTTPCSGASPTSYRLVKDSWRTRTETRPRQRASLSASAKGQTKAPCPLRTGYRTVWRGSPCRS